MLRCGVYSRSTEHFAGFAPLCEVSRPFVRQVRFTRLVRSVEEFLRDHPHVHSNTPNTYNEHAAFFAPLRDVPVPCERFLLRR